MTLVWDVLIICHSAPTEVVHLSAVPTSEQSFLATWNLPLHPNSQITGYHVYYRRSSVVQNAPISSIGYTLVSTLSMTREIMNLLPFSNYTIHVQAIGNPNLLGAVTKEVLVLTNITNPTAIRELETNAVSSSSIQVTWNPPAEPNGPISHYVVYFRENGTAQTSSITSNGYRKIETTQTTAIIENLDPYTYYAIHVQAYVTTQQYVLQGAIAVENVQRTWSDIPSMPPTHVPDVTTIQPTLDVIQLLIPSPLQIETGRVM